MADKVATYAIKTDSNAREVGKEGAEALESLRASIANSTSAIRQMGADLRNLRGSTEEVKGAKDKLKASIEAERNALSGNALALIKAGTSYEKLSDATKKAAAESKKMAEQLKLDETKAAKERIDAVEKSLKSAGGPVDEIRGKFDKLSSAFGTSQGAMAMLAVGAVAVVTAIVAVAAAIVDATEKLARWVFVSALAWRQSSLLREAYSGTAESALHLGHQLDDLATHVATSRAELEQLAAASWKSLNNSRLSGQGIVDTFRSVAVASAAMGDEVGSRISAIIERGKNFGRAGIGRYELQGAGVSRDDVAAQLAKSTRTSVQSALVALGTGRVEINTLADAIRRAVELKFGDIDKKIKLGTPLENLEKRLNSLTSGVKLEPLLGGFEKLEHLLDADTVTGDALRKMIQFVADRLGPAFSGAVPIAKVAFEQVELAVLKFLLTLKDVKKQLSDAFAGEDVGEALTARIRVAGEAVEIMVREFVKAVIIYKKFYDGVTAMFGWLKGAFTSAKSVLTDGWGDVGTRIIDGIISGISKGISAIRSKMLDLARQLKEAFTGPSGIDSHSPSKAFEKFGRYTVQGYAQGIDDESGTAQDSVERMAPSAPDAVPRGVDAGGSAAASHAVIEVHMHVHGGGDAHQVAAAVSSDGSMAKITRAIEDLLTSMGIPTQIAAAP